MASKADSCEGVKRFSSSLKVALKSDVVLPIVFRASIATGMLELKTNKVRNKTAKVE